MGVIFCLERNIHDHPKDVRTRRKGLVNLKFRTESIHSFRFFILILVFVVMWSSISVNLVTTSVSSLIVNKDADNSPRMGISSSSSPIESLETGDELESGHELLQIPQIPMTEAFSPEINVTVTIFPSYYHVGMVIKYVGGTEPFIHDSIQFPENFTVLNVKDSKSDLAVTPAITEFDNMSELVLTFNRSLLPSEIVHVALSGVVKMQRMIGAVNTTTWWKFKNEVAFQQVNIRIFPNIIYYNASMVPDTVQVDENGFLMLRWSLLLSRGFKVSLLTYNTAKALNELIVLPSIIAAVITDVNQQLTVSLINFGLDPVQANFQVPSWLSENHPSEVIRPLSEKKLFFTVTDFSKDSLVGFITIFTNRSSEPLSLPLAITIRLSPDEGSSNWAEWVLMTMFGFLVILMVGFGVWAFKNPSRSVMFRQAFNGIQKRISSKNLPKLEARITSIETPTLSFDGSNSFQHQFLQSIIEFPVNEREVLKYVFSHPGCTQQDVSSALGLSKSTVSRITRRLQSRKYLHVEKTGMSHSLYVNKDLFQSALQRDH